MGRKLQVCGDHHRLEGKSKAHVTSETIPLANQYPASAQGIARGI